MVPKRLTVLLVILSLLVGFRIASFIRIKNKTTITDTHVVQPINHDSTVADYFKNSNANITPIFSDIAKEKAVIERDRVKAITINTYTYNGMYRDLYFGDLVRKGDDFYVKFAKQLEDKKLPEKCFLPNGEMKPHSDDYDSPEFIDGCAMQGRPLVLKTNPEVNLTKYYHVANRGLVELIHYDDHGDMLMDHMQAGTFYNYINVISKPVRDSYYFSDIINDPTKWGFDVVLLNGEVISMKQVYQE